MIISGWDEGYLDIPIALVIFQNCCRTQMSGKTVRLALPKKLKSGHLFLAGVVTSEFEFGCDV